MRKLLAIAVVCGVASAAFGAWGDTSGRILPDRDWGNRNGDGALVNAGWAQSCRIWKWRAQEVAVYDWNDAGRTAILDFMTNNPLPDPADGRYVFRLDLTTSGGFLETPRFDNVDSTGASTRFTCRTLNIMEDSMDWSEGDGCDGAGCGQPSTAPGGTGIFNWTAIWNDTVGAATNLYARSYWKLFKTELDEAKCVNWSTHDGTELVGGMQSNNETTLFRNPNWDWKIVDGGGQAEPFHAFVYNQDPGFQDNGGHVYMDLAYDPDDTTTTGLAPAINNLLNHNDNRGIGTWQPYSWDPGSDAWIAESGANCAVVQNEKFNAGQSAAIVVWIAHYGDANNDKKVSVGDVSILGANWGKADGRNWHQGDFTRDGRISIGDVSLLSANWGWDETGAGAAVPEPASLSLLLLGAVGLVARKRR